VPSKRSSPPAEKWAVCIGGLARSQGAESREIEGFRRSRGARAFASVSRAWCEHQAMLCTAGTVCPNCPSCTSECGRRTRHRNTDACNLETTSRSARASWPGARRTEQITIDMTIGSIRRRTADSGPGLHDGTRRSRHVVGFRRPLTDYAGRFVFRASSLAQSDSPVALAAETTWGISVTISRP
jgi:hypothetical protein